MDRRKHPRFVEELVTTYQTAAVGEDAELGFRERPCWLRDLSEGGALLLTERPLGDRTPILLQVAVPGDDGRDVPIEIRAETCWSSGVEGDALHRVGVRFTALATRAAAVLRRYLAKRGADEASESRAPGGPA